MTKEQATQKLNAALDAAFSKYGRAAGMCDDAFFPHYSEVKSDVMRPTWYMKYQIDADTILYTMYESVLDMCISTLFVRDKEPKAAMHTGYPKTLDDAKKVLELFEKD